MAKTNLPQKKSKEPPAISIIIKYTIQETVTIGKIYQDDSLMHPKNKVNTNFLGGSTQSRL